MIKFWRKIIRNTFFVMTSKWIWFQLVCNLLAVDGNNDPDVLSINAGKWWTKEQPGPPLNINTIFPGIGIYYTPRFNKVERGVYWFHLVRLSVCGQNRVRSVSSTILIRSISYLHILSSNFRRCVACNVCFKIQKFEILANSLNL